MAARALNEAQLRGLSDLQKAGAEIRTLPDNVRAEWAQSLSTFPNQMAKDADSRGLPGSTIIAAYIEAVSAAGHQWPVDYTID